jgi:ribosome maturation factor RimP
MVETSTGSAPVTSHAPSSAEDQLLVRLNDFVAPLGYEIVHVEVQTHREKILRVFIDRLAGSEIPEGAPRPHDEEKGGIGIDDCALVSRTLDEPLETLPEVQSIFKGATYELEVSSPGVDRPLRREKDFTRFAGRKIRLNTFRPLTGEELENASYGEKNPRQKNFQGELLGLTQGKIRLKSILGEGEIQIPLALVAKANLDPDFDFSDSEAAGKRAREGKSPKHSKKEGVKS